MISLVETQEEDSSILVATHVANLLNDGKAKTALAETPGSQFLDDCTILVQEQRYGEFLERMIQQLDLIYSKCNEKDAECCVNIMIHLVPRLPAAQVASAATALATALATSDERSDEKLTALLNLYGISTSPELQYTVLMKAAEYARRTPRGTALLVAAVKGKATQLVRAWGLSPDQARELYLALAALYKSSSAKAGVKEYLRLVTEALGLVRADDAAALAAAKPHAVHAIIGFVRSPTVFQFDLAEMVAVRQLADDAQYAGLHALMTAILAGDLAAFKEAATPAVLEQVGISAEAALGKARMVALLALGSRAAHEEVPFSDVAKALAIPVEQVELWVVRAVGSKLLEAKIDQVREVVLVTRCTHQTFSDKQWAGLAAQLGAWSENLAAVQQLLASTKVSTPLVRGTQAVRA